MAESGEAARIALRCGPGLLAAMGVASGVALPARPLTAEVAGPRAALWLGPDEWLLLAGDAPAALLVAALEAARAGAAASVVDISGRQVAFTVAGPAALDLLAEGCPLDLEAWPVNGCARTLYGKAEVILWRRAADRWRMEVAQSFAPYLEALLAEVAADLDPGYEAVIGLDPGYAAAAGLEPA